MGSHFFALSLFFALIVLSASVQAKMLSLGNQLTPEPRNQGYVGNCSVFASTTVLEAAYFREYGKEIHLSEMWFSRQIISQVLTGSDESVCKPISISTNPLKLLMDIHINGVCSESTYPYRTPAAEEPGWAVLESGPQNVSCTSTREIFRVADQQKQILEKFMGAENSPVVVACRREGEKLVPLFNGFTAWGITNPSNALLVQLLQLGIVSMVDLYQYQGHPAEFDVGSGHSVVLIGFDFQTTRYHFRNSWGKDTSSPETTLGYDMAYRGSGATETEQDGIKIKQQRWDLQNITYVGFALGPKDRVRICAHTDLLAPLRRVCP